LIKFIMKIIREEHNTGCYSALERVMAKGGGDALERAATRGGGTPERAMARGGDNTLGLGMRTKRVQRPLWLRGSKKIML
jgi:hypothetical protein